MKETTANEPAASADPEGQAQRLAVLFACIAASQAPGHSGYAAGQAAMREARGLVLQTITERHGRIVEGGDDLIVGGLIDATEALKTAIAIQRGAVRNRDNKIPLSIRIFIHCGEGQATEEDLRKDLSTVVAAMSDAAKPGHIYVSKETYNSAQGLIAVEFRPLGAGEGGRIGQSPLYDVAWHAETDCTPGAAAAEGPGRSGGGGPFVHGAALAAGTVAPCFYCGARKHPTTACPSKHLPYATNGLKRLGSLSMDEINRLFSDYLNRSGDDLPVIPEPASKEDQSLTYLAPWAFYELKRVFQLRFLDVAWNASSKADWHKARERRGEGSPEGGMLWFARDCIRTSRLDEAEDLLRRYGRMNPGDYRTSCGLALVKVEKESYVTAADYLTEALNQPTGNLQKTYLLLLLSRVYEFLPDLSRSDEMLRDALAIEPYCPEGMFEQIIRHFLRARREADAVNRLVKLIRIYKEYYAAALISPELVKFHGTIAPELQKLVAQTRGEAEKLVEEADREVATLAAFVGENDADVARVLSSHKEMRDLLDKPEALFNQHEAVVTAARVIMACKDLDRERADHAASVIRKIDARLGEAVACSSQPQRAEALFGPIRERLARVREDLRSRAPLAACLAQCEETEREVDAIERRIRQTDAHDALVQMWTRLSRGIVVVAFITAIAGLVFFPGAVSALHALRPDSLSMDAAEIWAGQKAILVMGGFCAFIFAAFRALSERRSQHKAQSRG